MELPVKQEAFKCWLESCGIACGNIFGEVKHRGQHSKTFHAEVLSLGRPFELFQFCWFVLIVTFRDCKSSRAKTSADCNSPTPELLQLKQLLVDTVGLQSFFFSRKCAETNKSMKVFRFIQTTCRTKRTAFFLFFLLLPRVSEGHKHCHVVYMLTQKEGQVLAIRSLGLM